MATSVLLLLQCTILPLLTFCLLFLFRPRQPPPSKKNSPPSPPRLPIIGNFHQLGTLPHHSFHSLSQKHGDLILLHLGSMPALVASSVDAASSIMKTNDLAFCSKPQSSFFVRIVNNGKDVVGAPYGDDWRNMKNICVQELLSKTRVQSFRGVREDEVARMMQRIEKGALADGGVVNLREAFVTMTEDSISRATLGVKYKRDRREVDVGKVLSEMTELMGRVLIGECIPWLGWMDGRVKARADRVNKAFDDFLERVISERCVERERNGNEGGNNKDFVDVLLEIQRGIGSNGSARYMPIDKESIKGILLDMFIAGIEPISSALEWIMAMLLKTPRVMEKLQQEIREAAKGKTTIVDDDLKTMVYLKAVIQETLRLHPPASLLSPRECIQDVRINGYDIAAGTMVFINGWAIGRDPKHWEEPERFHPERFLKSPSTEFKAHDLGMVPFGYGRRNCPGESFAIAIIETAIANLVMRFDWALPLGAEGETLDMTEGPGIITKRMAPLLAVATPWLV